MSVYTYTQAVTVLRGLGFRVRSAGEFHQVIAAFQAGYNLGSWLAVDGVCGPKTSAALARSRAAGGKASAHFTWREFACTCGGHYSICRRILVRRELLQGLEKYRARTGSVSIASGYRCPRRNLAVGGVSNSQHLYGTAADVTYQLSNAQVKALRAFAGIGRSGRTGMVRHVDRRDVGGHNNGGTLASPMMWVYAS
jgi:Peptidase M15